MKGQYKIISEIMLFAIGIVVTSLVVVNYQNVKVFLDDLTIRDNLLSVSDLLSTGIIKAAETRSIIRIRIPDDISGHLYTISIKGDSLILANLENPELNATRQLFNISQSHNITVQGNLLMSSSRYLQIRPVNGNITIEKWVDIP